MKKKNLIALSAGLLGCTALVGVGFSAWIITNGDKVEASGNVTVVVGDVVDQRFDVKIGTKAQGSEDYDGKMIDSKVNFDCKLSDDDGQIQFSDTENSDDNYGEDLEFSWITNIILNDTSSDAPSLFDVLSGKKIQAYLTAVDSNGSNITLSDYSNFIAFPLSTNESAPTTLWTGDGWDSSKEEGSQGASSISEETTTKTSYEVQWIADGVFKTTCTFGWGSATGFVNPGSYDAESLSVSAAESALQKLQVFNNSTWTVHIVVPNS